MRVHIIHDSNGENTGVFIPFNDWNELKNKYKDLAMLEEQEPTKEQILDNIRAGWEEVKLYNMGKLKTISTKDFLDEL